MDPIAAELLNAMGDICLREDSASSNAREYSSNNESLNSRDDYDVFLEEKSDENENDHWLKSMKINDRLDVCTGRWSKSWHVGTIEDIVSDSLDSNIVTYLIRPNSKWVNAQNYKIDFRSLETIQDLMPLNTYTPYHLPFDLLDEECTYNGTSYGRIDLCSYCNRNSCIYCLLMPDKNNTDKQICYFCVSDQYKSQNIKILSSKVFNPKIENMDIHLLDLIHHFVGNEITTICCSSWCKNTINLDISNYLKWPHPQRHGSNRKIPISLRWSSKYYHHDINGPNIYQYQPHREYEYNQHKYKSIELRSLFGLAYKRRIFCNSCCNKLRRCEECHSGLDTEKICKQHAICSVCDEYICAKWYIHLSESKKCKLCNEYYHRYKCGLSDICENCAKLPLIIHHRSKEDLMNDLKFNRWRTAQHYRVNAHKDSTKMFDKLTELYCRQCNENGHEDIKGCLNINDENLFIGVVCVCSCCGKLVIEDIMDAPQRCDDCGFWYGITCCSSVGYDKCLNCVVKCEGYK